MKNIKKDLMMKNKITLKGFLVSNVSFYKRSFVEDNQLVSRKATCGYSKVTHL